MLFYNAMVNPQDRTIVEQHITPANFNELYLKYRETLSCPCSTTTVPFKDFISNTISFHPVCSSKFVTQQWIEALYLPNASVYGLPDFRKTASSQVCQHLFLRKIFYQMTRHLLLSCLIMREI
jgi:hypothetical protein